ncbi:MAG: hypothetical protein ACR2HV_08255, partial [Acidimicrobiales bacterium]
MSDQTPTDTTDSPVAIAAPDEVVAPTEAAPPEVGAETARAEGRAEAPAAEPPPAPAEAPATAAAAAAPAAAPAEEGEVPLRQVALDDLERSFEDTIAGTIVEFDN